MRKFGEWFVRRIPITDCPIIITVDRAPLLAIVRTFTPKNSRMFCGVLDQSAFVSTFQMPVFFWPINKESTREFGRAQQVLAETQSRQTAATRRLLNTASLASIYLCILEAFVVFRRNADTNHTSLSRVSTRSQCGSLATLGRNRWQVFWHTNLM